MTTVAPAPRSLLIRSGEHACVAWWHAPAAGARRPLAVVLASSWGEEDLSAYDGQRVLACRLAEAGLGTLRFDWPDSGDSSADSGSTSTRDALAALAAAAEAARGLSGCDRLAFGGLRLGALLAAQAAVARADVVALVALLPVASGRAFVREQRMLGANLHRPVFESTIPDLASPPVALGGFMLSAERAADLGALKWPCGDRGAVRDALLLTSAGGLAQPVLDAFAKMGMAASERVHADLASALAIAHQAHLAASAVDEIVHWLRERAGAATVSPVTPGDGAVGLPDAPAWMRLRVGSVGIREQVCRIDAEDPATQSPLVGVLSERDAPGVWTAPPHAARTGRRAVLLLSSGRERRIGPHRVWVPFARQRAARGDVVLRMDVGGIGDSAARAMPDPDGTPELYDPRCVHDVARALAWLRREHGVGSCTVMGICSGAYHAWRAALGGVDIQQIVPINPLVFHPVKGRSPDPLEQDFVQVGIAADARRSVLDPARWRKLLTGRANVGLIAGAIRARLRHMARMRLREVGRVLRWPLKDDLVTQLHALSRRGVAMDFVFAAREPGLTLLREGAGRQGLRLENDKRLQVCVVEHADHTFAGPAGRAAFYARLDTLLQPAVPMSPVSAANPLSQTATARP